MTKNELVQAALSKTENPQILINMVSKRVRQLGSAARPLIHVEPRMTFMDVALKEIAEGKLTYKYIDEENNAPQPA
ncbi:MAG: DNA-directed RNA polymerase subunit omega [Verrucomicrobiales bacterium]|jgi:DNA-directed RNA polymerase subunit omega|nr:DNA-directed RNA polymerase subunit omega [Verrucomicrobiales bacterium]